MTLWAAEWRSANRLDGETRHWLHEPVGIPVLFQTRRECRAYIEAKYGYIRDREDLRREPHGWRVPRAVRVLVVAESSPDPAVTEEPDIGLTGADDDADGVLP